MWPWNRGRENDVELLVAALKRRGLAVSEQNGSTVKVERPDHWVITWNFKNILAQLRTIPSIEEKNAVANGFLDSVLADIEKRQELVSWASDVTVILKTEGDLVAMVSSMPEHLQSEVSFLFEGVGSGLVAMVVLDTAQNMKFVTTQDLKECGVAEDDVVSEAFSNLNKSAESVTVEPLNNGIVRVSAGDVYDAARLLTLSVRQKVEAAHSGPVVYAVPSRSHLFAANASDPRAISSLATLAQVTYAEADHALTPSVLRMEANGSLSEVPTAGI